MLSNTPTLISRFVFVSILTVALMILDHRSSYFDSLRSVMANINTPFHFAFKLPDGIETFVDLYWPNTKLRQRVIQLEQHNRQLLGKMQKYAALEQEKNRLLILFSASQSPGETIAKMGRIIRTSLQGAQDQRIVIDRGSREDVALSQAVIDASGLIGQVSMVARDHSVVTVITDANHAVPVEIVRNGLNVIARGTGVSQILAIPFISPQADIEVGDVLVSTGLGGVFPAGHPVATIIDIIGIEGEPFMKVKAKPFAELDKIKNVLLLEKPTKITLAKPDSADIQDQIETENGEILNEQQQISLKDKSGEASTQ